MTVREETEREGGFCPIISIEAVNTSAQARGQNIVSAI